MASPGDDRELYVRRFCELIQNFWLETRDSNSFADVLNTVMDTNTNTFTDEAFHNNLAFEFEQLEE